MATARTIVIATALVILFTVAAAGGALSTHPGDETGQDNPLIVSMEEESDEEPPTEEFEGGQEEGEQEIEGEIEGEGEIEEQWDTEAPEGEEEGGEDYPKERW